MATTTHPADAIVPTHEVFDLRACLAHARLHTEAELAAARAELMRRVEADSMTHFYQDLCRRFGWPVDAALLERMAANNAATLDALLETMREAERQYGDVEIKDARLAIAHHYCRIGDWAVAQEKYEEVLQSKAIESTGKVNIFLTLARIRLFEEDAEGTDAWLAKAEKQFEIGGDWEARNRMRVYKALHLAQNQRKFDKAAELLISALATFTTTELLSFEHFVKLTVLLSSVSLERPILKNQVAKSPEVLQVLAEDPVLHKFFTSFMDCNYHAFFEVYKAATDVVMRDRYIGKHYRYFVKRMRLVAYRQYLKPYKSVTIASMASAFGVSPEFIEAEIVSFIPTGLLPSKIDRVEKTLITDVEDVAARQYRNICRAGDDLTNQLQMLSKVIDM